MGIIINLPNNVKHYASINRNAIYITKQTQYLGELDENNEPINSEPPENPYSNNGYMITANFDVWDNADAYRFRETESALYTVEVNCISPTVPTDIYTKIYEKFKTWHASYIDDDDDDDNI